MYNTSSKKYVNLDDIAALIRQGAGVHVVDAKSGEDLTRLVLTQVIVEDAKGQPSGLPLELLRQLIVASDGAGREFIMSRIRRENEAFRAGAASPCWPERVSFERGSLSSVKA